MKNLLLAIYKANNHLLKEGSVDDVINFCIRDIGLEQNIDRCYVFNNVIEDGVMKMFYSYEWCNDSVESFLGNPELSGVSYDDLPGLYAVLSRDESMHGLVKDNDNEIFKRVMEKQSIQSYLFTPIFANSCFWGWIGYDSCKSEREWKDEEVYALHTVAKNIGFRITQESTLSKLQRTIVKFNYSLLSSNQALWEFDIEKNKTIISYNWGGMLGFTNDEILDAHDFWIKSIHPYDKERAICDLELFIAGKLNVYEGVMRMLHKKGHFIWVKFSGLLEKNREGIPVKIIGTHIDISEIKEQEHQMQLSEEKFRFIAKNSKDLICQHRINGSFTYVSESSLEILGYTSEEMMGKRPQDLVHQADLRKTRIYYESVYQNKQRGVVKFRIRHVKGFYIWLETSTKVIVNNENSVIGFQTSNRDITERVSANIEIKAALSKERKFYELKSKFISMASHQFRTPLTVIYSNSELLDFRISRLSEKIVHDFNIITSRIKSEVDRMTELMDNILVFGKYEAKIIEKKIKPIDFNVFIKTLKETFFDNNIYSHEIAIQTIGKNKILFTDETLMVHIMINVLTNACKYSAGKPSPVLIIEYQEKEILIEVIDYGIGIPEDDIKYLFTSFFRASNTSTITGSGLGLTIVKQFTEILNGTIELKSKENYGTKIKLTFPYEQ